MWDRFCPMQAAASLSCAPHAKQVDAKNAWRKSFSRQEYGNVPTQISAMHGCTLMTTTWRAALAAPVFGLALGLSAAGAVAQKAEDAFGTWVHPENGSHVSMYACGSRLCARIVKITDDQKTDDKNPNAEKRDRPIIGLVILSAKKTGPNRWTGSLYNRTDGKTYTGTVTVSSRSSLSLSGCTMGIFCKTATWTRVGG
jgi:uncharacterized protein (DUF2147 family)